MSYGFSIIVYDRVTGEILHSSKPLLSKDFMKSLGLVYDLFTRFSFFSPYLSVRFDFTKYAESKSLFD